MSSGPNGVGTVEEGQRVVNALTVDVEDYFQVSAFESVVGPDRWPLFERRVATNTNRLLDLFAGADVRATFFVLGWVAEREPTLVRRIADEGHEIGSHGYWHRLVYEQEPAHFREDVRRSKLVLEAICGKAVLGFRAPSYSITKESLWALEVLSEEGFAYDASVFPIHHDRYGIPSAPRHPHLVDHRYGDVNGGVGSDSTTGTLEIPGSTVRIAGINIPIAGGGYFRLLPYRWTRWGISHVNMVERKPVVFYVHPWELDPDQPRLQASWCSMFRHYRNLSLTESRLRRLLADFRFDSIAGALLAPAARPFEAAR